MPTARPELAYAVYLLPRDRVFPELIRYVKQRAASYHAHDRAMVFCRSKVDTQKVASALGVPAFFAESEKELRDANDTVFRKWVEGSEKIMVCTSILGCGVDLPCVRDVIHFDLPYTAIDKHQQENRAGRDGKPANVVTFVDSSRGALPDRKTYDFGTGILLPWAKDTVCRRLIPGYFIDGVADPCTAISGAQLCDNCKALLLTPIPPIAPRLTENPFSVVDAAPASSSSLTSHGFVGQPANIPSVPNPSNLLSSRQTEPPRIMQTVSVPRSGHMAAPPPPTPIPSSSSLSTRPAPSLPNFAPAPLTPAGIQVLMTGQKKEEQEQRFRGLTDTITAALNTLRETCIACFVRGAEDWQAHSMAGCKQGVCSPRDSDWQRWRADALNLPVGWCYKCCLPQVSSSLCIVHSNL